MPWNVLYLSNTNQFNFTISPLCAFKRFWTWRLFSLSKINIICHCPHFWHQTKVTMTMQNFISQNSYISIPCEYFFWIVFERIFLLDHSSEHCGISQSQDIFYNRLLMGGDHGLSCNLMCLYIYIYIMRYGK